MGVDVAQFEAGDRQRCEGRADIEHARHIVDAEIVARDRDRAPERIRVAAALQVHPCPADEQRQRPEARLEVAKLHGSELCFAECAEPETALRLPRGEPSFVEGQPVECQPQREQRHQREQDGAEDEQPAPKRKPEAHQPPLARKVTWTARLWSLLVLAVSRSTTRPRPSNRPTQPKKACGRTASMTTVAAAAPSRSIRLTEKPASTAAALTIVSTEAPRLAGPSRSIPANKSGKD